MVTQTDIENSLIEVGLNAGDTVLFHSSLKSFGQVDGGAEAVISAFLNIVTGSGTVVVPTFCQKNFDDAYKTWHIDKPSDVGYITEVFRKMPDAVRSNQATHSVAAIGKKAEFYTKEHGNSGKRQGIYGDTPFAADSPWQKMYDDNALVVFLGVGFESYTFKHLLEYQLAEYVLNLAKEKNEYDKYLKTLCNFETRKERGEKYIWPYIYPSSKIEAFAKKSWLLNSVICFQAKIMAVRSRDFGELLFKDILNNPGYWYDYDKKALYWLSLNIN